MKVKIGFDESSRAVTAHVQVEGDNGDEVLAETKRLFQEAKKTAGTYTLQMLAAGSQK